MRKIFMWFWLLNKRLYKKITFVLLLLMIPLLVVGYGFAAQEESGVMTIALAQDGADPMATQVIEKLINEPSLVRFVPCDSTEAAKDMIRDGKADAAWLFPKEMEQKVYRFIQSPNKFNAFIRVVERSDSVPLRLTREKLSGTVFSFCSRQFYLNYLRENVSELDNVSDEALLQHYDEFIEDANLFEFAYLDAEGGAEDLEDASYLTTPVRGLLAVIVVLAGLAAAMYFVQDSNAGTFSLVPQRSKAFVELTSQLIAITNTAAVMFFSLLFGDLTEGLGRELLVLALYCLGVALFCMNIRQWCNHLYALAVAMPLLIVVMLVVCPVFFDFAILRTLQFLFPPTYYVNAIYSNEYLLLLCIYNVCLIGLYSLSCKLLKRA